MSTVHYTAIEFLNVANQLNHCKTLYYQYLNLGSIYLYNNVINLNKDNLDGTNSDYMESNLYV